MKFVSNIVAILKNLGCVHHSHMTGKIVGYAHSFCNEKVRENYYNIPVVAHNLFRFDFFFLMKGMTASVWKTRDIVIGGKNPTDINFASVGHQVQFIDTIKYFQQSLGALASSLTSLEKTAIYEESKKFLLSYPEIARNFLSLNEEGREWVLNCLSSGKGTIPYQLITDFDSRNISPEKDFFEDCLFYSNMKDSMISWEDYQNVRKFYILLTLENLGELNRLYDFQDTIILSEILSKGQNY